MDCAKEMTGAGKRLRHEPPNSDGKTYGMHLAEKLLQVRDRRGLTTPLKANAAQRRYERARGSKNIVLKARQMGITTWVAGRFFLKTVTERGVLTVQVAHTREAAEGIFAIVQRMWENLPAPLREGPLQRSRANVGQMVFPHLDSEFRVVSAADENAGRGLTIQNLHCSEVGRWPGDAAATLAGLRAALAPGGEICLESTPRGAYGCFYEEWMQASETGTVQHFFPWWLEPAYTGTIATDSTAEELALIAEHGLSAQQIGYRRGLQQSFRGLRAQEFAEDPVSCFKTAGQGCFEMEKVEARLADLPQPAETRRGGALQVWLPPLRGKEYLVAVDTAGGGSLGDFAAIQVIELNSGLQCAELRERLGTLELARVAAQLGREYRGSTGPAMLCVERNNHGSGVLAYLDSREAYPWVYEHDGVAGWLTTAGNKPAMVSRIGALLEDHADIFLSARLLEECRTFVTGPGGRTGAAQGTHDDCLMAMAVAQAVRAEKLGQR